MHCKKAKSLEGVPTGWDFARAKWERSPHGLSSQYGSVFVVRPLAGCRRTQAIAADEKQAAQL